MFPSQKAPTIRPIPGLAGHLLEALLEEILLQLEVFRGVRNGERAARKVECRIEIALRHLHDFQLKISGARFHGGRRSVENLEIVMGEFADALGGSLCLIDGFLRDFGHFPWHFERHFGFRFLAHGRVPCCSEQS
jgi:hypothetical protein